MLAGNAVQTTQAAHAEQLACNVWPAGEALWTDGSDVVESICATSCMPCAISCDACIACRPVSSAAAGIMPLCRAVELPSPGMADDAIVDPTSALAPGDPGAQCVRSAAIA
ncbi:hypothetical protein LV28_16200 [Pandoraea pnomenusa]|uniref:Uncharacterized protein n=1 Tax=Pandoraea pnomenusa TaxID=93220 RepID=A0A378YQG4_9BURK|nr:hypothetical protein LV28_16200 [Pandoraea pnomenusa]SUA79382.1 Uncharacterised protein [Pandoraea pnomenusa]